jgi:hypothetical protein
VSGPDPGSDPGVPLPPLFRREFDLNPLRAASEPQPGGQGVCWMRFGAWPALTRRYARTAGLHRLGREPERRSVGLGLGPDAWFLEGVEKRRSGSRY